MNSEERMKQFGSSNPYGSIGASPALPAARIKSRNCSHFAATNRKRWLEHQKKLALAIVRLCAGASSRKINRGGFNYQTGAE